VTPKLKVRQAPERGHYDEDTIHAILDASLVGHVSFVEEGIPVSIPTAIARIDDAIYLHGNRSSRMFKLLASGIPVCVSTCIVDGLVKARSGMHCSMNYRSVVVFGTPELVDSENKPALLYEIVERLIPGTRGDYRAHLPKELKATALLRIDLTQASAKIRAEGVNDDKEDLALEFWAGVVPIRRVLGDTQPSPGIPENVVQPLGMREQVQKMLD